MHPFELTEPGENRWRILWNMNQAPVGVIPEATSVFIVPTSPEQCLAGSCTLTDKYSSVCILSVCPPEQKLDHLGVLPSRSPCTTAAVTEPTGCTGTLAPQTKVFYPLDSVQRHRSQSRKKKSYTTSQTTTKSVCSPSLYTL